MSIFWVEKIFVMMKRIIEHNSGHKMFFKKHMEPFKKTNGAPFEWVPRTPKLPSYVGVTNILKVW